MSSRVIFRSLVHRIAAHPDILPTYTSGCESCGWAAEPSTDGESVDMECLAHAGRSGHRQFTRTVTGRAFVVREGEKGTPPALPADWRRGAAGAEADVLASAPASSASAAPRPAPCRTPTPSSPSGDLFVPGGPASARP